MTPQFISPILQPSVAAAPRPVPALRLERVDIGGQRLSFEGWPGELVHVAGGTPVAELRLLAVASGHGFGGGGRCWIDGIETMSLDLAERETLRRRLVARALQTDALQPRLPLLDNVALAALARGVPAAVALHRAELELDALGLHEHRSLPPSVLNPGETRLAIIARALACRPRLLVVERPELGLDADAVACVRAALQTAAAAGGCCVLMTSRHSRLAEAADRRVEIGARQAVLS